MIDQQKGTVRRLVTPWKDGYHVRVGVCAPRYTPILGFNIRVDCVAGCR